MALSGSRLVGVAMLAVLALAGCESTQERNARAGLVAQREILGRKPVRVDRADPRVDVSRVTLLRGTGRRAGAIAVVVDLRSRAATPLTDLPITVGVRTRRGRTQLLNARAGTGWFQTHVPSIPALGRSTWVFTARHAAAAPGRPFARVGPPPAKPLSRADRLPALDAAQAGDVSRQRSVKAKVANASGIPQDDVPVYALARRNGRYVAAGRASIVNLDDGERATVKVGLIGRPARTKVQVQAQATVFK